MRKSTVYRILYYIQLLTSTIAAATPYEKTAEPHKRYRKIKAQIIKK